MKSALSIIQKYYPNVTSVRDSSNSMEVQVTKKDCSSKSLESPNDCAMARACKRQYDGAVISPSVAYMINGKEAIRFKVPTSVSREIISFDRSGGFQPGDYWLKAPSDTEKLGPRKHPQPKNKKKGYPKTKSRYHRTAAIRSL